MLQKFSIPKYALVAAAAMLTLGAAIAHADDIVLKDPVVDRYTVVKGDTLWGIAGKFLKDPWRWPEIWRMNREQIRNPHRIYPGDVIVLDKADGQWRLTVASLPNVRLSPTVRVTPIDVESIPSVPPGDIEPFLSWPLITGPAGLQDSAEIIAGRDQRVIRGEGDMVYATGIDAKAGTLWRLYRPGRTLTSLDNGEVLGYEQQFLGTAKVERFDTVSTMRIVGAREEILVGDRLVPSPREQVVNYAPHPPDRPVNGRIIALGRDAIEAARGWIVTIDKGNADGIDVGTVFAIYRVVPPIPDPRPSKEPDILARFQEPTKFFQPDRFVKVPDERTGLLFVFRVFDRVSYGLVLNTSDPVELGDYVRKP
jgi:LysM domain-containing protein